MLEITDLRFAAPSEGGEPRAILDGFTFAFSPGRFYVVTGPNASGKTTLCKLVMGVLLPSGGSIRLDGEEISRLSVTERARRGIAYAFQHPPRFKGLAFRDLLALAAGTAEEESLVELLLRVGFCSLDFLDKPVDARLSGGEAKKIELATVLARRPRIALYDEPDTGIDLWTVGPMVELLKEEQRRSGNTTVVVSHNEKFLAAADEILLLKEGRLDHVGNLAGVFPRLSDLDYCGWTSVCAGGGDARCRR